MLTQESKRGYRFAAAQILTTQFRCCLAHDANKATQNDKASHHPGRRKIA
jgi:hypothetical protein